MRHILALSLLACAVATTPASAAAPKAPAGQAAPDTGPQDKPAPHARFTTDELFDRLAKSTDEAEAKGIASLIERRWLRSGSDTADLLMSRALEAFQSDDQPLAIELLDRVIALQPDWAEAWNKRATVFYMMGDYTRSMADLEEVLRREPRHFGALAGMGMIFSATGDEKHAYQAFKKALALNPSMDAVKTAVEKMAPEMEGQDL